MSQICILKEYSNSFFPIGQINNVHIVSAINKPIMIACIESNITTDIVKIPNDTNDFTISSATKILPSPTAFIACI